jgi:hypothetical protein
MGSNKSTIVLAPILAYSNFFAMDIDPDLSIINTTVTEGLRKYDCEIRGAERCISAWILYSCNVPILNEK